MKIYTKRGDMGKTDLFGGERVLKNHPRVKAYGDIDCANSAIGLAYSSDSASEYMKRELLKIMKLLFAAGAEVATAPKESAQVLLDKHLKNQIGEQHIKAMEDTIDQLEKKLVPITNFILPCGSDVSARLHFVRNMVRMAEISLIDLNAQTKTVRAEIIKFFNRLSDLMFVLARFANAEKSISDITWSGKIEEF